MLGGMTTHRPSAGPVGPRCRREQPAGTQAIATIARCRPARLTAACAIGADLVERVHRRTVRLRFLRTRPELALGLPATAALVGGAPLHARLLGVEDRALGTG